MSRMKCYPVNEIAKCISRDAHVQSVTMLCKQSDCNQILKYSVKKPSVILITVTMVTFQWALISGNLNPVYYT